MATWSARNPWRAIVGWAAFVAACLAVGAAVGTNTGATEDFWIGEAGRAESIAAAGGLTPPPVEQILLTAPAGPLDVRAADAAARDVAAELRALPEVAEVADPARSADSSAVRGLRLLGELAGGRMRPGIVLYTGDETVPFGPNLAAVPIRALWTM